MDRKTTSHYPDTPAHEQLLPSDRLERWHSMLDGALWLAICECIGLALFFGLGR